MTPSETSYNFSALIIDPDAARAESIGSLLKRSGVRWAHRSGTHDTNSEEAAGSFDVIFVSQIAIEAHLLTHGADLRSSYPSGSILVGIVHSSAIDSPTLFGSGLDLLLYEPLRLADIERSLGFVDAVRSETREQSRDRLRKMTALQELAITAGRQTGVSGWMDRLVEAGQRVLGADALAMWSIDAGRTALHCIGSTGLPDEYIRHAEKQSHMVIEYYDKAPQELSSHGLSPDDQQGRLRIVAPDQARAAGIKQIAWMPVRDVNRLYGHLSFYFMSDEAFRKYDLVLADAFAAIVAAALGTHSLQSEIHRSNRLYREHVEMSPNGVIVCHPDGTIERANRAVTAISGLDRFEILGRSVFDLFRGSEGFPWDQWVQQEADEGVEPTALWMVRPDGQRRRISCYARRLQLPHSVAVDETEDRIQLVLNDVTVQARRLVELELFHDLTRLISERGSIEDAYELVASRLYNYLNYRLVTIGEVDGSQMMLHAYRNYMTDDTFPLQFDVTVGICGRALRENSSLLVRDVSQYPDYFSVDEDVVSEIVSIIRVDGQPVGLIDIQTDASQPLDESDLQLADSVAAHLGLLIEQVTIHDRLERQAMTDPLTGMANRRAFMEALNSLVNNPNVSPAGLFLVELDHFKQVNDRYGHLFGDEMLKQVGIRLRSVLRDGDVLARYGGDEIAVISRQVTSDRAFEVAERLRHVISDQPFRYDGQSAHLSVSIGIALYPLHGRTTDELIGEADRAMYAAKLEGRNSVHGDFLTTRSTD